METVDLLDHLGSSCLLRSMATKRHQTDNTNMAKIAPKNKKYGSCQFLAKIIKAYKKKNGH